MVKQLLYGITLASIAITPMLSQAIAAPPQTNEKTILLLSSDDTALYQEFIQAFRERLYQLQDGQAPGTTVSFVNDSYQAKGNAAVIVTIGSRAAATVINNPAEERPAAVLATLIPRTAFTLLTSNPDAQNALSEGRLSAVYLDQPFSRQLNLIKLLLPNTTIVGSILGPVSKRQRELLATTAQAKGLALNTVALKNGEPDPLPALQALLSPPNSSDVLLALPDGAVYNRFTIRQLLLATFRQNVPVIAYSQSLVGAGAVAGIYSQPAQLGRQAAETVYAFLQQATAERALPMPVYPAYFQVSVNSQVSELLGLDPPAAAALELRLKAMESSDADLSK